MNWPYDYDLASIKRHVTDIHVLIYVTVIVWGFKKKSVYDFICHFPKLD